LDCDARAATLEALALRLQTMALTPDYRFLYSARRRLFHIGYRVREQELDTAFYDLLASESRLTSLVAIAKGDVEAAHRAHWGGLPASMVYSRAEVLVRIHVRVLDALADAR